MKKLLLILSLMLLFLSACSSGNEAQPSNSNQDEGKVVEEQTKDKEPTQEELNEKLKQEATQADFVELNSDKVEKGKKVFATGEVTFVDGEGALGEFTLTTEESSGSGMYTVKNMTLEEVSEGDKLTVYGVYSGKDDLGMPVITVTIIER